MYGLDSYQIALAKEKVTKNRFFLDNNYVKIGGKDFALSQFVKNSYINPDRYIAEIQHRAWSIYQYASERKLKNIFLTITLPSEWHKTKTITTKRGTKKTVKNARYNELNTPKNGAKELSKLFRKFMDDRSFRDIPKKDRVYFRVNEPHKNGTPHLHASIFVPEDKVDRIVKAFKRKFDMKTNKIETNIWNPVNYLMKYVLKTLDDLRFDIDNFSELTLWYIYHGISRIYTSRTFAPLEVYRVLGGRFDLLSLTQLLRDKNIEIYVDPDTNKVMQILEYVDNVGFVPIWTKKPTEKLEELDNAEKVPSKWKQPAKKTKIPVYIDEELYFWDFEHLTPSRPSYPVPKYMSDQQLHSYYNNLDVDDVSMLHFGITQNEYRIRFTDQEIHSLDDFSIDFDERYGF
jgi:hypothetical protein